jgi:hypothetical protein
MRVLVGCEMSGAVRDAFRDLGHDAISCDLRPSRAGGPHYAGNLFDLEGEPFDLVVLHPPCTYLSRAGIGWADSPGREQLRLEAVEFFRRCLAWPAPSVAVENPVMMRRALSLVGVQATQFVDPFMFGDPWSKKTGLWLRGLPELRPTSEVAPEFSWTRRSRHQVTRSLTSPALARAMASQWSAATWGVPATLF